VRTKSSVWKLSFYDHRAIRLTQNCVWFTNSCINLIVPLPVTREYHSKLLERLVLLHCIAAHLQHMLPWLKETHNTSVFSMVIFILDWLHAAENRSCACRKLHGRQKGTSKTPLDFETWKIFLATSGKIYRRPCKVLLKRCRQYQIVCKKQTVGTAAPNSDSLVGSAVTVYPIQINYEEDWWQHAPLSESNTHCEELWFNSADTDTNVWTGIRDLTASNRRPKIFDLHWVKVWVGR